MFRNSSRNRFAMIAASAAAGVMLLTACNGTDTAGSTSQGAADSVAQSLNFLNGTAEQNSAQPKTGDWANAPGKPAAKPVARKWVQLSAARAGDLDPVVVNGAGFTLHRFDKDTADPSKSNCDGDCATTWPPVLVAPGGKIFIDGVDKSAVGVVKRTDGTLQVTIGGWPVYRFSKDLKPGDTNGQGVGGTWFGVTPDGQKAGVTEAPDEADADQGQEQGEAEGQAATSAVLFDDPGFADNGSQGLAGQGCKNVFRDDVASSIQAAGSLKIWTGADCTGKSKVIEGDVADLAAIGFNDDVSSVFFG
ncbi:hypothetical protein [Streptomyces sp. NBC_00620]|uniref:hypothetical protein n=1 Tax=Streptomyces sp. NBC_00620 TaxID=2903666 RepID=UPI00224DFEE3|nr:hypothetical protein [Streptomyces sp. NBC_00620]MCX4973613.1 hypothetical protein [Streptomyces sp. NBC_00620]